MSDANVNTPASKTHSETIIEMSVIMSLAEIGELVAYPENGVELDSLSKLFRVIKERLDTLIEAIE